MVQWSGFMVQGSVCRVQGAGFRVQGLECREQEGREGGLGESREGGRDRGMKFNCLDLHHKPPDSGKRQFTSTS